MSSRPLGVCLEAAPLFACQKCGWVGKTPLGVRYVTTGKIDNPRLPYSSQTWGGKGRNGEQIARSLKTSKRTVSCLFRNIDSELRPALGNIQRSFRSPGSKPRRFLLRMNRANTVKHAAAQLTAVRFVWWTQNKKDWLRHKKWET